MPKVFLSYSRQDLEFASRLNALLVRDGVDCFFDRDSIQPGADWVENLEKAIEEADALVLVVTPSYLRSKWTKTERNAAMAASSVGKTLIPLLLKDCTLPTFLSHIQALDVRPSADFDDAYKRLCSRLGVRSQGRSTLFETTPDLPSDRTKLPPVTRLPVRHRMPHPSLKGRFVGRVQDLWRIHDILQGDLKEAGSVGQITGMTGVGKTQLAIEYVHRFAGHYPGGLFWVDADRGRGALVDQVAEAAGIGIEGWLEEEQRIEHLWRALSQSNDCLIVLDNLPEDTSLQDWLPASGPVHCLVTTRRRDLTGHPALPLGIFDKAESLQLLSSNNRSYSEDEASPLLEQLAGLPLALELARSYLLQQPHLSPSLLAKKIEKVGEMRALTEFAHQYRDELPTGHEKQIAATFELSWSQASPLARHVLRVMSMLAPHPVPRSLLSRSMILRSLARALKTRSLTSPLDEALQELAILLSMVEPTQDPSLHWLVQTFVRTKIIFSKRLHRRIVRAVVIELRRAEDEADTTSYQDLEAVIPHGEYLISAKRTSSARAIELCNYIGLHHYNRSRLQMVERWWTEALRRSEEKYGAGHAIIARSQSNLAAALQDLGQLVKARDLARAALASDQKRRFFSRGLIATRLSNLALILQDMGDLEEARDLLRQAVALDRKCYGLGSPKSAKTESNLAQVLARLGQLQEASSLHRETLALMQKAFQSDHPNVATARSNLALTLPALGQPEEACDLLRQALEAYQQHFEPDHDDVSRCRLNLGLVLHGLGESEGGLELIRQSHATLQEKYPPGHPLLDSCQNYLAMVLLNLGKFDEASRLLGRSVSPTRTIFELLGRLQTATGLVDLTFLLQSLGGPQKAYEMLSEAIQDAENRLPPDHPDILQTKSNLALVLRALGKHEEARTILDQVLKSARSSVPPGHPFVLLLQINISGVLIFQGKLKEARELLLAAHKAAEDQHGRNSPLTQTIASNLEAVVGKLPSRQETE